jgi:predicted metal-dependent hydrolase
VTFSLNLIDQLASENSLLDIRNRRRQHRTLIEFEKNIEKAREVASKTISEAEESIQNVLREEQRKLNESLASVQKNNQGSMTQGQFMQVLQTEAAKLNKNMERRQRELRKEANTKIKSAERDRDELIKAKEESVQFLSVVLPPIPLLIIALLVFIKKKTAEIQGATASRVRS